MRIKLNIVDHGSDRDQGKRQAVSYADFCGRSVHDRVADLQALRCQDVALYAVFVADQSDVGCAVRIVLDADDLSGDAVLRISLEIDDSVLSSVSAAFMSDSDLALVVSS